MFHSLVLAHVLSCLATGAAAATPRWTIDQIVSRALATSSQLQAAATDVARDRALARQAGRWTNPDLALALGPMKQADVTGRAVDASIRQTVPLFGQRRVARQVGEQDARSSEVQSEARALELGLNITLLAYRLAAASEEHQHIAHRQAAVRAVARFLETRPQASPLQVVERELLRNRLREVEEELIEVEASTRNLWSELNVHLQLDQPVEPAVDWERVIRPVDRAEIARRARANNPSVRLRESAVAGARLRERQARVNAWPEVRLGAGYNEQTADLPQTVITGLIEVSLPIVNRGADAREAAAAARLGESHRLTQARRELESRLDQAWSTLEQSQRRLELYPARVLDEGEREVRRGELGWRRGLVPTATFLELEHQMHARAVKYYATRVDYVAALGQVRALEGQHAE